MQSSRSQKCEDDVQHSANGQGQNKPTENSRRPRTGMTPRLNARRCLWPSQKDEHRQDAADENAKENKLSVMRDDSQDNRTDADNNESENERCDVDGSFHGMRV